MDDGHRIFQIAHLGTMSGSLFVVGTSGAATSLVCPACPPTTHPDHCTHEHKCTHEESCSVEVRDFENERFYLFGCKRTDECQQPAAAAQLMGRKRGAHHDHHHEHEPHFHEEHSTLVCSGCCTDNTGHCNKDMCASFMPNATAAPQTAATVPAIPAATGVIVSATVAPSMAPVTATSGNVASQNGSAATATPQFTATVVKAPTTTANAAGGDPNCLNHEEDGISCATLDLFHLCTDTSTFAYVISHEKCAAHCGFCKPSGTVNTVPVTPPPGGICADFEQDGFTCAKLDLFGFCTGTSSLEYVLAHEKCRKHCGFC